MSNEKLQLWNAVKRPPKEALKTIQAGRLKGMSDINPQWRLQIMTEMFGPVGIGWYYEVVSLWTEQGATGEVMAFAHIHLYTKNGEAWSAPIAGIGGSALVAKESNGLRANDEAYKMATTDALSVAMKQLGIAADIYMGLWDGSKYKEEQKQDSRPKSIQNTEAPKPEFTPDRVVAIELAVDSAIDAYDAGNVSAAHDFVYGMRDSDEVVEVWNRLKPYSAMRSAIKRYREANVTNQQKEAA
jgi:hypothetical protein